MTDEAGQYVYLPDDSQSPTATRVARNVRRAREQRGLSAEQLSDRLQGIGWPLDVEAMERDGNAIKVDDVVALALVLNVTPHVLMFSNPDPEFRNSDKLLAMPGMVKGQKWGVPASDLHDWADHGGKLMKSWDWPVPLQIWFRDTLAAEEDSSDALAPGQPEKLAPFAALLLVAEKLQGYWVDDMEAIDPLPDDHDHHQHGPGKAKWN